MPERTDGRPDERSYQLRDYDPTVEWACCWQDCAKRGPLGERLVAFFRHHCRGGHGYLDRLADDDPALIFDACAGHTPEFQRVHGLEDEPEWLRRSGMGRRPHRPLTPVLSGPRLVGNTGDGPR